ITRRKVLEAALAHQATHDALTGLPNRSFLRSQLQAAIEQGMVLGVLFIDLDGFKEVNDRFGHHVGDELLTAVALRFTSTIGPDGTAFRLGGDEFAIILPGAEASSAERVGRRLEAALRDPLLIEGQALKPLASIGCSLFPQHGTDTTTLMRRADNAMYNAKASE